MTTSLPHACDGMVHVLADGDNAIIYRAKFREFGLSYRVSPSYLQLEHCPFCGVTLPASVREEWFERVWALGLEPGDENIPPDLRSDAWWRAAEARGETVTRVDES